MMLNGEFSKSIKARLVNARSHNGNGNQTGKRMGKRIGKAKGKGTSAKQKERDDRDKSQPCPCSELGCNSVLTRLNKQYFTAHLRELPSASALEHYNSLSKKNHQQLPTGMTTKWFQELESKRVFTMEEFMNKNKNKNKKRKK